MNFKRKIWYRLSNKGFKAGLDSYYIEKDEI